MRKKLFVSFLLMITYFSLSAQGINLNLKRVTVEKAIAALNKAGNYSIVVSPDTFDLSKVVSVEADNASINDVLAQIFVGQNASFNVSGKTVAVSKKQDKTSANVPARKIVKGRITDANTGEAVIGASILQKGTNNGVVTDLDGNFSLSVPEGSLLVISSIGYETTELAAQSVLNVKLREDALMLEETIVVGYGTLARKDISTSIATVNSKDFNIGSYTNPAQLLQGKVAGLHITQEGDPTSTGSISLRGASTLREGSAMEPYYIIDGIPGVSLSLISPDDIETIDVLRDASATAIYGSKAANGVIIVTTKSGGRDGKVAVDYSGYVGVDNAINLIDVMSADELRAYAKDNNLEIPNDMGADTNWQKEVLRTAFSQNHNVSINGGNQKTQYSASINYLNKDGVLMTNGTERLTARSFVQSKGFNDRLQVSVSINGSVNTNKNLFVGGSSENAVLAMYYFSPLAPVKNSDGSWYDATTISQNYNPVALLSENTAQSKTKTFQTVGKAALTIVDGLVWNVTGSYQNTQYLHNEYSTHQSQLSSAKTLNGKATRSQYESTRKQLETYFNYDKLFNDVHKLGVMAGYSWEQSDDGDGYGLSVSNFYDDSTTWYNIGLANTLNINDLIAYTPSTLRMISFYGRVNYSFDSRYNFQATIRRDGSSAFGANNRWGTFPSASFAWRVIQEPWMKNQNIFSDLKLRAGYGVSGNSLGFGAYTAIERYGASSWFSYTDESGNTSQYRSIAAVSNANPDLKWERTSMLNLGVDFGFFDNRLTGTVEVYNKWTDDLIYSYSVSTNRYPYGTMIANVGNISNKGIELTLKATPVQAGNFKWNTSLVMSHNNNIVTCIHNDEFSVDYVNTSSFSPSGMTGHYLQRLVEGEALGSFYLFQWAGRDEYGNSLYEDYDSEGNLVGTTQNPGDEDRINCGSAQPKLTLGWDNHFSYKGWGVTAFFHGVFGNKVYNEPYNWLSNVSLIELGKNASSRLATDQDARDANAARPSNRYLENGSFFRLATLQLSYNFGKIGNWLNDLQLYVSGNNIFTITKYSGTDPEVNLGGLTPGIDDLNRYPLTRSMLVGAKINF